MVALIICRCLCKLERDLLINIALFLLELLLMFERMIEVLFEEDNEDARQCERFVEAHHHEENPDELHPRDDQIILGIINDLLFVSPQNAVVDRDLGRIPEDDLSQIRQNVRELENHRDEEVLFGSEKT